MRVIHLADIHVKDERRDEYKWVFNELSKDILTLKPQPDIIVIAGDIFDTMSKASARNWEDVAYLLGILSKIAKIVLIPGNHDLNVRAEGAPDLIGPMLQAGGGARFLQPPLINYWNKSGIYNSFNALWVVGIPGQKYPTPKEVKLATLAHPNIPVIGLYHESVGGAKFPNGMLASETMPIQKATLANLVKSVKPNPCAIMLGDIHLRQEIMFDGCGDMARAWYPGSLICLSFGEHHNNHGYLVWDIPEYPYNSKINVYGKDIINPKAVLTVRVDKDGIDITDLPIPSDPRAYRILHDYRIESNKLTEITNTYIKKYNFQPRSIEPFTNQRFKDKSPDLTQYENKGFVDAFASSSDWKYHQKIASDILKKVVNQPLIQEKALIRYKNNVLETIGIAESSPRAELVRLEFDNMFCYGTGNVVDFNSLRQGKPGLIGFVAKNRAGKSNLFDIITFAICDEFPRGTKRDIARHGGPGYSMILTFKIDGKLGKIIKTGLSSELKRTENTIKFWFDGNDLTADTVPQTAKLIRDMLGSKQWLNLITFLRPAEVTGVQSFMLTSSANRRKILSTLLNLGSFEKLLKDADSEIKGLRGERRALLRKYTESVSWKEGCVKQHIDKITEKMNSDINSVNDTIEALIKKQTSVNEKLSNNEKQVNEIKNINTNNKLDEYTLELNVLITKKDCCEGEIKNIQTQLASLNNPAIDTVQKSTIQDHKNKIIKIDKKINELNSSSDELNNKIPVLDEIYDEYHSNKIANIQNSINALLSDQTININKLLYHKKDIMEKMSQIGDFNKSDNSKSSQKIDQSKVIKMISAILQIRTYNNVLKNVNEKILKVLSSECKCCRQVKKIVESTGEERLKSLMTMANTQFPKLLCQYDDLIDAENTRSDIIDMQQELENCNNEYSLFRQNKFNKLNLQYNKFVTIQNEILKQNTIKIKLSEELKKMEEIYLFHNSNQYDNLQDILKVRQLTYSKLILQIAEIEKNINYVKNIIVDEQSRLNKLYEKQNKYKQQQSKISNALNDMRSKLAVLTDRFKYHTVDAINIIKTDINVAVCAAYRKILHPKTGIGAMLLKKAVEGINSKINNALKHMEATFHIKLSMDYEMELVDNVENITISPSLGSGYQKFVLSLATRWALAQMAKIPLPACFMIDEGFGCLDNLNLPKVAEALSALALRDTIGSVRSIMIAVTHRDDMLPYFSECLKINKIPIGDNFIASKLVYPPNAKTSIIEDEKTVYHCDKCNVDITSGYWNKHINSEKHKSNSSSKISSKKEKETNSDTIKCIACKKDIKTTRWDKHILTKSHNKNNEMLLNAKKIAEETDFASIDSMFKLHCNICKKSSSFTANQWQRHLNSMIHKNNLL